jgi:hypothetical protein
VVDSSPGVGGRPRKSWYAALTKASLGETGTFGVVSGLAADWGPVPTAFVAATLNVYVVPFVSPATVWLVAVELNALAGCAFAPT